MIINENKIVDLAKANGYDHAIYAGESGDYVVYKPIYWDFEHKRIGIPHYILVNGDSIRMTIEEEYFDIIKTLIDYTEYKGSSPIKLGPKVTIKSFKFIRGDFPESLETYEYKSTKRYGKVLTYDTNTREKLKEVGVSVPFSRKIVDNKFDDYALKMIKYINKDFGDNLALSDGEWFEFSAKLSDGQNLRARGFNYLPVTYYRFIEYLIYLLDNDCSIPISINKESI